MGSQIEIKTPLNGLNLFKSLPMSWKVIFIMGIITAFACVALIIFIILLFKTDLIPFKIEEASDQDIQDYNYIFENFGKNYHTKQNKQDQNKDLNDPDPDPKGTVNSKTPIDSKNKYSLMMNQYKGNVKDLEGNYVLDLLDIKLVN
jgi:hypothetical protein